jgi:hypothetical protein
MSPEKTPGTFSPPSSCLLKPAFSKVPNLNGYPTEEGPVQNVSRHGGRRCRLLPSVMHGDEQLWHMRQTTAFDPKQKSTTYGYQVGDLRRHSGFLAVETESLSAEIQNVHISTSVSLGIHWLNDRHQFRPRHHAFHLVEKPLAASGLAILFECDVGKGLLVHRRVSRSVLHSS